MRKLELKRSVFRCFLKDIIKGLFLMWRKLQKIGV